MKPNLKLVKRPSMALKRAAVRLFSSDLVPLAVNKRNRRADVTGRIECPWCRSSVRFTVLMNGLSRGHCTSCQLRWCQ